LTFYIKFNKFLILSTTNSFTYNKRRVGLVKKSISISTIIIAVFSAGLVWAGGQQTNFGIGLKAGLIRLEGDWKNPSFKPAVYGQLTYNLFEYLAIGVEGGYATVGDKDQPDIETIIIPYEGHLTFSFFPLGTVNPYVVLGAGGVYWNYTVNGQTEFFGGKYQKGYDSFIKSGGGLEISLNQSHTFYFNIGATFRYSLTDWFDRIDSGDENDGVIDLCGGFTYYFRTSTRGDRDNDGVPDELDLKPEIKEDPDGYMDHDGKPDGIPPITVAMSPDVTDSAEEDKSPPVVIHSPVKRVEADKDIRITSDIYENKKLKVASILYRPVGFDQWRVGQLMNAGGTLYKGVIPGRSVKKQGVEYCVIAVDEAISGVGYCGLPKLPSRVEVLGHSKLWRIISGTAALAGWGTSGYLILRKQK